MRYKTHLFLLLFLFCLTIYGQGNSRISIIENKLELISVEHPEFEEKVNVDISNTTLSNFLLAISKVHGININVSPALDSIEIINNFSNVSIGNLLIFLAKEYNLDINFTGNIISISKFKEPAPHPLEKEIIADYNSQRNLISLDLRNDPLEKVFRKITDVSGKNMVFAPGMENIPLSIYIANVPFEAAMEKLALSNNLKISRSRDGFYIFNSLASLDNSAGVITAITIADNFYYRVLDSVNKIIEVDFKNVPASDIIYSIGEDLNLNIFTSNSLKDLSTVTVKAESIHFETLLNKIFESANSAGINSASTNEQANNQGRTRNNLGDSQPGLKGNFTYKKEGDLYFFGTEDQLALKQVEVVQMMHRSIEMLSNPSGSSKTSRNPGRNNMAGNSNQYGNNNPVNNMQGGNYQNNTETRAPSNANRETGLTEDIKKIIPAELLMGIEVKIDSELNSFVISGPAARIERFKDFIQYIDKPVPVILIEVMILEVNRSSTIETGVSFGLGSEPVATNGQAFPSADIRLGAETVNRLIGGFDGFGSLNMGKVLPNFYMDLKAMESNGNLKILSTPKLSTLNGHKAHLSSGQTTYYAVTSQSFYGSQIPQTSEITNYYPIDAELALDIMPFVSGDGEITLDINVVQSSFNGERVAENAPPGMNSREFSSIIRMRDQDVAILGGIEETTKDDSGSGVPLLARIPLLKWLFSERRREDSKRKLSILIKPTVIY
jgi:type IV pilus assembly protein PilQ